MVTSAPLRRWTPTSCEPRPRRRGRASRCQHTYPLHHRRQQVPPALPQYLSSSASVSSTNPPAKIGELLPRLSFSRRNWECWENHVRRRTHAINRLKICSQPIPPIVDPAVSPFVHQRIALVVEQLAKQRRLINRPSVGGQSPRGLPDQVYVVDRVHEVAQSKLGLGTEQDQLLVLDERNRGVRTRV